MQASILQALNDAPAANPKRSPSTIRRQLGQAERDLTAATTRRDAVAAAVRKTFPGVETLAAASMAEALDGAGIVTLCTNATEPFYTAAMAQPGTHINAIGAIVPARAEFTGDVFPRCSAIAVDTVEGVRELSREFIDHFSAASGNDAGWARVQPISQVIREGRRRAPGADLTLFKAMGMGIADLAVAIEVLRVAEARGLGTRLPERQRQELPLGGA